MQKLLVIILVFCSHYCFSQSFPDYDNVQLVNKADYKVADTLAHQAADYVLTTPFEKNDLYRLKSLQFLIKWMSGTPDYTFTFDEKVSKILKGNLDLMGLYMAAMVKYCLENPARAKDLNAVELNSARILLAYCQNPANHMKITKRLEKLADAN